jgi:hypothetical protein
VTIISRFQTLGIGCAVFLPQFQSLEKYVAYPFAATTCIYHSSFMDHPVLSFGTLCAM